MRILIIEDEIIIARFIEQQIKENFDYLTAIAINRNEVENLMPKLLPHLILCDIALNEIDNGIQLIDKLGKHFSFETIYISSYESRSVIESALETAPLNYIVKPIDETKIYTAIKLIEKLVNENTKLGKLIEKKVLLNDAEQKILRMILEEKTTKEIADKLFLSPYTIKNYRHRICRKLELRDENNALLKWALQNKTMFNR